MKLVLGVKLLLGLLLGKGVGAGSLVNWLKFEVTELDTPGLFKTPPREEGDGLGA